MRRNRPRSKMTLIFGAFLVCAVVLGILMLQRYEETRTGAPATPVPEQSGTVSITLFFATRDGSLAREGRNIDACGDTDECMAAVVEELTTGPLGDLEATLPPTTVIRGVHTENAVAFLDFEAGFVEALPGGSSAEILAVYSIADSIAVNFPAIKGVKLLVDGKPLDALKGHLDLRQPIAPDFTLESPKK